VTDTALVSPAVADSVAAGRSVITAALVSPAVALSVADPVTIQRTTGLGVPVRPTPT